MTATFERLAELGGRLQRELADALLDVELDQFDRGLIGEAAAELLAHSHAAGVAGTLRELLQAERLAQWVERTCSEREAAQLHAALSGLLGGALLVGPDDPERLAQVEAPPREKALLHAWARRYDLGHELGRPAREVLATLNPALELTLADCLSVDATLQGPRHLLSGLELAAAAERYLRQEAMRVAALPLREALWQRPVPAPLKPLVERLRAVLDGAGPQRFTGLRFSAGRPVQLVRESGMCEGRFLLADTQASTLEARLYLAGFEQRAIEGACRLCSRQPCVHAQALAARLLDACLCADDRLHASLLAFAARPSWQLFFEAALPPEPARTAAGRERTPEQLTYCLRVLGDAVSVAVQHQTQQAAGGFSGGRLIAPTRALSGRAASDHDRPLLELLAARSRTLTPGYVAADLSVLRALCEQPRVQLEGERELLLVREEVLEVRVVEHADGLRPELYLGTSRLSAGARAKPGAYLIEHTPHTRELRFAALAPALKRLLLALDQFRGVLPKASFPALATYLASLDAQARVTRPASLLGHERPVPRRFLLRLAPLPDEGLELTLSMRPLALSGMWPPGAGPELVHGLVDGEQIHVRRDLAWERSAAAELLTALELSQALRVEPFRYLLESRQAALALLSRASRLSSRVEIEWAERAARLSVSAHVTAGDLKVALFKRGAFFFPEGGAQAGPVVLAFTKLLDAARLGERFVRIEGGDFAEIESALFARLREAELCTVDARALGGQGTQLKLSVAALPFWLARLGDVCAGNESENSELARAAADALAIEQHELPAQLLPVLRNYQREGVRFLLSRARSAPGALLADEMGLGKTLQSIALLVARAALGPALVVCPTSLVDNWCSELARFAPELEVLRYRGARRREQLAQLGSGRVLVLSYELLARDRSHFDGIAFATQVIDEAQVIRNARTLRARAVASLEVGFRVALSGTPIENRLGDLWSLFHVIAPGLLGSWSRFRARFAVPIERYDDAERAAALQELIGPLSLRRRKDDVASELPSRTEVIQLVALSPGERALYASALAEARRAIGKRNPHDPGRRLHILAELTRLRQLACHPRLVLDDARVESSKLAALMTLLRDVLPRGHRVLVFSQFVRHLRLIREALERAQLSSLWLSGSTPPSERTRLVASFQAGAAQVFLISLKAGGTGLNLTAADYVVHMDPWWNPSAEDQASDRAHRIGQLRPVSIVKLVAQDTIEERVLVLHEHKRRLAARVVGGPAAARVDATDHEALLHV